MTKLIPSEIRTFRKRLLKWFDREKRKLPWRGETDPYRILVSEIMLQQTRVSVVEQRYKLFLREFPNLEKLARVSEQRVLAAWSGLGYYRRARALHAAARAIARSRRFPGSSAELEQLAGIGRYTAAAVASIAFGEPTAVVDGNVKRVLARVSGRELKEQENWSFANTLLDPARAGDFNQALMELGAVVCVPGKPLCGRCPVTSLCAARGSLARKEKEPRRKALMRYTLALRDGRVLLKQRPRDASLMAGMWELPEGKASPRQGRPALKLRHSITATDYTVLVYPSLIRGKRDEGRWVRMQAAKRMALTGLTRKILRLLEREQG